jgi:hypothetical protein
MKKIMTLMLGLALVLGTTAAFGADDTTKSGDHKSKKGKKGSKKSDTTTAPAPTK